MKRWILQSDAFGYPMWIGTDGTATDQREQAEIYDERDSRAVKEQFFSTVAGYPFRAVEVSE